MSDSKLTAPILHLNGTGHRSLLDGYEEAVSAMVEALEAVKRTAPHGRDYYVSKDPDALTKATAEHRQRVEKLEHILEDMHELAWAVSKQQATREKPIVDHVESMLKVKP